MQDCELISTCPFYKGQLKGNEEDISELKEKYCKKNNLHCARYMVLWHWVERTCRMNFFPIKKKEPTK